MISQQCWFESNWFHMIYNWRRGWTLGIRHRTQWYPQIWNAAQVWISKPHMIWFFAFKLILLWKRENSISALLMAQLHLMQRVMWYGKQTSVLSSCRKSVIGVVLFAMCSTLQEFFFIVEASVFNKYAFIWQLHLKGSSNYTAALIVFLMLFINAGLAAR